MLSQIKNITASPVTHHDKSLTVQGVVRTISQTPFPHFTLEDRTGTLICESMSDLPSVGAHIQIDGKFFVGIPQNCSGPIPLLKERTRSYLMHQRPCGQTGCEFEKEIRRGSTSFAFAA